MAFAVLSVIAVASALSPNDVVAVVGASGNVGKLVALRLSDTFRVRAVSRHPSRVAPFLQRDNIELVQAQTFARDAGAPEALEGALRDVSVVVVCTGTTAFPTKAWSPTGESDVSWALLAALVKNGFDIRAAVRALDSEGFNTPNNVDAKGIQVTLDAWKRAAGAKRKRFVLMSSVGVTKREGFPFKLLNACGVLDAKAEAEAEVRTSAEEGGFHYTIVRPGQLFGGPYDNNYYLGTLFQLDKDAATQDVVLGRGDSLIGDTLRSTLAEVIAQAVERDVALDTDFVVVNRKGQPPSAQELGERLATL